MPRLLISVRNEMEAEAALAGGADLIDIKEPANGPLGRAASPVIESAVGRVAGRAPISAACGELAYGPVELPSGLTFAKFGLAGWRSRDWAAAWTWVRARLPTGCEPVAVAYADWQRCDAPPVEDVAAFAVEQRFGAFLIDTCEKNGVTLLDRLPDTEIALWTSRCHSAGVPVALAGSLGRAEIARLLPVQPDWVAVRGAACRGGRDSTICEDHVRDLKRAISVEAMAHG